MRYNACHSKVTKNQNTAVEQRYILISSGRRYPYGETRLTTGTIYTDKLFTGQREMSGLGIYHYQARFYSPKLGRFLSADTIVPGMYNPQALNRYMYVLGNPLRYTDPTGHKEYDEIGGGIACYPGELACQLGKGGYKPKPPEKIKKEIDNIIPDGWKSSIVVSVGWGSNLDANGQTVPTVSYWGLSLLRDNYGGIQLFYESLDIEFNPTLQLKPGEQAQPSELFGIGISATKGPIWRTDGDPFVTSDYKGEAHSSGGSWGIATADYYESFPNPNVKGLDIGFSGGSPSLWSISTQAIPIFNRFDLTFWQDP